MSLQFADLRPAYLENSSFSHRLPKLQIYWDSTSMGTFMECARKYYLSIVFGFSPRDESVHLKFGIIYHSALETYDREKFSGRAHKSAMIVAVRKALRDSWDSKLNRPWFSDHKYKNRLTLMRTIIWYLDRFEDDPLQTVTLANGKPAVELSFRFRTSYTAPTGEDYWLCGHLDRLAQHIDDIWIADRKTTYYAIDDNYFDKFSPDNQMSTYDFAGKIVYKVPTRGIIIDAAQVQITQSQFKRGQVPRTESERNEWYNETIRYNLELAASFAEKNFWPMNLKSCGNYGGCPFRPICGRSPEVRAQWLKATYVQRVWDPLQVRGDI